MNVKKIDFFSVKYLILVGLHVLHSHCIYSLSFKMTMQPKIEIIKKYYLPRPAYNPETILNVGNRRQSVGVNFVYYLLLSYRQQKKELLGEISKSAELT